MVNSKQLSDLSSVKAHFFDFRAKINLGVLMPVPVRNTFKNNASIFTAHLSFRWIITEHKDERILLIC